MTDASGGWEPLRSPGRARAPRSEAPVQARPSGLGDGLVVTSFTKLARVQVLSSIGDGLIAVALAGSIFFSIDPSDARWRVALYLVLTIAPFAIVTPLLGPAIDRAKGGRRLMIVGSLALRAIVAFLMIRHIDSLLLFPEAFVMLVLQKAYFVSRAAIVPAVCPREDELIEANSKLSLISAFAGVFGGAIGAMLVFLFDNGGWATGAAALFFIAGAFAAVQVPQVQVAAEPPDITEKLEVRGANIVLAASAVGIMRAAVGFTTFLLAFHLRAGEDGIDRTEPGAALGAEIGAERFGVDVAGTPGPPTWHFGAAGLAVGVGAFLGARYAPRIRESTREERIVSGALICVAATAYLGAWGGGIAGIMLLSFGVGLSAALAKLGFDALVQRDAPLANHGRTFARFEGRFQLMWAFGAFLPVIIPIGIRLGTLFIALAATFAAVSYEFGRHTDTVQRSSRVRRAIRERVPDADVVDRLGLTPVFSRFGLSGAREGKAPSAVPPTSDELLDPTTVAPRPDQTSQPAESTAVESNRWSQEPDPHLSSGHGVWLEPDAGDDPTVNISREPGEDGQYRLWADDD